MSSNGLLKKAKSGTCRICQRVRKTDKYVKPVGEVIHGFAVGHIWECIDIKDCDKVAKEKINKGVSKSKIETALKVGRFSEYMVRT